VPDSQCASREDQAAIGRAGEFRDAAFDVLRVAYVERAYHHPKRRRHGVHRGQLCDAGRSGGIAEDRNSRHAGCDLFEQFQPFAAHAIFEQGEAGGVATRPRQARDVTGADGIGDLYEHDRHAARCLKQRSNRRGPIGQNDIRSERDQFADVPTHAFGVARAQTVVDPRVAAVDPAQLLQPLQKCCDAGLYFRIVSRPRKEHADAPHPI
jgi:hypothetical protein